MIRTRQHRKAGFTLVEIALATVLVTVGVLSLFWIITTSLENSRLAMADTQSAMFAQAVFAGMRAQSVDKAQISSTNWSKFWMDVINNKTGITVASGTTWNDKKPMSVSNGIGSLPFKNYSTRQNKELDFMNHALTYQLTVKSNLSPVTIYKYTIRTNAMNDTMEIVASNQTTKITAELKVWDGLYSSMNTNKALIYYSEFSDPGDL